MFAVPGWSVPADALKAQVNSKAIQLTNGSKPAEKNADKPPRKRKRSDSSGHGVEVTEDNLGDLWKRYIEENVLNHGNTEKRVTKAKQKKTGGSEEQAIFDKNLEVDQGTSEGLPEGNSIKTELKDDEESAGKKRGKQKKTKADSSALIQANGDADVSKSLHLPATDSNVFENGKIKYEQRKAQAAKKREQKALLQANGTLPPTRSQPTTNLSTETDTLIPDILPKAPKLSTTSSDQQEQQQPPKPTVSLQAKAKASIEPSILPTTSTPSAPPPRTTNLTPLQQRMAAKLTSARFRHLNQTLYTTPSDEAMRLFTNSPQAYTSYHAGFRAQVAVWPQNPVEGFIEDVKIRGRISFPSQKKIWREQKKGKKGKEKPSEAPSTDGVSIGEAKPLPRTKGTCTIADLGCGDAHLAASLHPLRKPLNLNLSSFDLAKGDTPNAHLITVADTSNLSSVGVKDGGIDIAICCLSLMGTNWVSVVDECSRIVRGGGEVWVAEIKSRFARPGQMKKKPGDGKIGDGIGKQKKKKSSGNDDADEEEDPPVLEEIEDGSKASKDETDISAFVEVFRKRGLNLKDKPDMANKMFVRISFVKALRSENEKGGSARFGDGFRGKQARTKFLDNEAAEVDESKVLKPCVYKTR